MRDFVIQHNYHLQKKPYNPPTTQSFMPKNPEIHEQFKHLAKVIGVSKGALLKLVIFMQSEGIF